MRRAAGGFDHFGDVRQECRLVVRSGPSPVCGRHVALANLGVPICLDKELTPRTEANTVLGEPLCGAILISKLRASGIARRRAERGASEGALSYASHDEGGGS